MVLNTTKYVILKWTVWPGYFFTWMTCFEIACLGSLWTSDLSWKFKHKWEKPSTSIQLESPSHFNSKIINNPYSMSRESPLQKKWQTFWVKISFKITKEHLEKKLTPRLLHQRFLLVLSLRHDHHLRQPLRPIRRPSLADLHLQTRILKRKLESLLESKIFFFFT